MSVLSFLSAVMKDMAYYHNMFCRFGTRFPSTTSAYAKELRKLAMDTCKELGMEDFTQTGVYFYVSGPSYETPAECRMIRTWGGDAVGMSTAPEVVVAVHCGMKVLGEQQ